MRPELVVGAGAALLIAALAGVEWWAEHEWPVDAVVRPGDSLDDPDASASPRLTR
jgi:hypothetical protein